MILSTLALDILLVRPELRQEIADAYGVTDQSVRMWRRYNTPNGKLTLKPSLTIIEENTGLTQDQILIDEALAIEMNEPDCQQNKNQIKPIIWN